MIHLQCQAMNYEWGKIGKDSYIHKLLTCSGNTDLKDDLPYAELWIGDHDKAPSKLENGNRLKDDPKFGEIKYLFKVLSVNKPLSIQVHPSKEQAIELHKLDPKNYPDNNDKPEMAVAITQLNLLYSFRPFEEIKQNLQQFSEFSKAVSADVAKKFVENPTSENLENLVLSILTKSREEISQLASEFNAKVNNGTYTFESKVLKAINDINKHFPGDVGIFFPLILNVVECAPGSSLYIPAGVLHTYLEGDLYEAMLLSDNVVRAGMTPKFIDIKSIKKTVNFVPQTPFIVQPNEEKCVKSYIPPHPAFCIKYITVPVNESADIEIKSPACGIVQEGNATIDGKIAGRGVVVAIPAGKVHIKNESNEPFICIACQSN